MSPESAPIPYEGSLPRPLQIFVLLSIGLTVICLGVELWCGHVLHMGYPYNWPLMPHKDPYRDFYLFQQRFAYFHSRLFFTYPPNPYLYPAPPALFYRFFFFFPHPTRIFLWTFSVAFAAAACLVGRVLIRRGASVRAVIPLLVVAVSCSYPFFFDFEQANIEWIGCVLVSLGIWAFLQDRGYSAAACFGIAASMKIYPLVFLGLFLSRRQYRPALAAVGVAALSTLLSLWMVCPDLRFAWQGIQLGVETFRQIYILGYAEVRFDHSLFAGMKALLLLITHHELPRTTVALLNGIYLSVAAFSGVILYFDKIRGLPIVNQVICLTVASILLPPVSYDYTLLHLYAPLVLLVCLAFDQGKRALPGAHGGVRVFRDSAGARNRVHVQGAQPGRADQGSDPDCADADCAALLLSFRIRRDTFRIRPRRPPAPRRWLRRKRSERPGKL